MSVSIRAIRVGWVFVIVGCHADLPVYSAPNLESGGAGLSSCGSCVWGPAVFALGRPASALNTPNGMPFTRPFTLRTVVGSYMLNLDSDGHSETRAEVRLNAQVLIPRTALSSGRPQVQVNLPTGLLRDSNVVQVRLWGRTGARIALSIVGGATMIRGQGGAIVSIGGGTVLEVDPGVLPDSTLVTVANAPPRSTVHAAAADSSLRITIRPLVPGQFGAVGRLELTTGVTSGNTSVVFQAWLDDTAGPLYSRNVAVESGLVRLMMPASALELLRKVSAGRLDLTLLPVAVQFAYPPSAGAAGTPTPVRSQSLTADDPCQPLPAGATRPDYAPCGQVTIDRLSRPAGVARGAVVLVHGWNPDVAHWRHFYEKQGLDCYGLFNQPINPCQLGGAFKDNLPGKDYFENLIDQIESDEHLAEEFEVWTATYESYEPIETTGDRLAEAIAANQSLLSTRIVLVGHSMGGLVARYAVEALNTTNSDVEVARVITLGTPHLGTPAANRNLVSDLFGVGLDTPGGADLVTGKPEFTEDVALSFLAGNITGHASDHGKYVVTHDLLVLNGHGNNDGVVPVSSAAPDDQTSNENNARVFFDTDHSRLIIASAVLDEVEGLVWDAVPSLQGAFGGRILDGLARVGIPGATVEFRRDGRINARVTTELDGSYYSGPLDYSGASFTYDVVISASGYVSVTLYDQQLQPLAETQLETVPLVPTSPLPGGIAGLVTDARFGAGVPAVTVDLRVGMNAVTGAAVASTVTSGNGAFSFSGLSAGTYSVLARATGYSIGTRTGIVVGNMLVAGQDIALSPTGSDDEVRIVLTWGNSPPDLDSHLTGPLTTGGRFHVFFASKGNLASAPFAALDYDDTDSYGPETTTISQQTTGVYRYSVHDYTNRLSATSGALGTSGATVTVYRGSSRIAQFFVPNRPGTLWTVFELDGNVLIPRNVMSYESVFAGIPSSPSTRVGTDAGVVAGVDGAKNPSR